MSIISLDVYVLKNFGIYVQPNLKTCWSDILRTSFVHNITSYRNPEKTDITLRFPYYMRLFPFVDHEPYDCILQ